MLRRVLERLSRDIVLRRALPAEFHGQSLYVSPEVRLAYLLQSVGRAERRLLEWAKEWVGPGESVWAVGADCGVFAMAAAVRSGATGRVLAIEPDPFLAGLLRRSAEQLGAPDARFDVLQAAATEMPGRTTLHVARRGRAASWLADSAPSARSGGARSQVEVEAVTLDGVLERFGPPTVVRIAVPGSEASLLRGAARLLGEVRPTLLMEVSTACRVEVTRQLTGNSYQLFDARMNPGDRLRLDTAVADTLALPGRPLSG